MTINLKANTKQSAVNLSVNMVNKVNVYGLASGNGAGEYGSQLGVWDLYYTIGNMHPVLNFKKMYHQNSLRSKLAVAKDLLPFFVNAVVDIAYWHRNNPESSRQKYLFLTGDHSNAIPVWSGVVNGINDDLGLIWIDSHLDSHHPTTSTTKNLHGMSVATLMGYGFKEFTNLINVKIKPQNMCFIGTNSFEPEELEFLQSHNVKIFNSKDITAKNIGNIMQQAVEIVSANTKHFGVSLDVDAFDAKYTPATGCLNTNGLNPQWIYSELAKIGQHKKFIGLEITEYNPLKDIERKTFNVVNKIIQHTFNTNNT